VRLEPAVGRGARVRPAGRRRARTRGRAPCAGPSRSGEGPFGPDAVAERDDDQGGTYRLELVSCGKARCLKCAEGPAHGPYWYRYFRQDGKVVSKYVGKNLPGARDVDGGQGAGPEPGAPALVSGRLLATAALTPNRWGTFAPADYPVNFHADGQIGTAIDRMGRDALLDVDGEPLAELLGRAATDAVVGRASSQEVLERITLLRDRLPQGGAARRELDEALGMLNAPASPVPPVPAVTPAPLRQLMADLHAVPLVRRDPHGEKEALARILDDFAAGRTAGSRLLMAVRGLRNKRHESVEGKFEVDRAVGRALDALEGMHRADRRSLYPPAG
jgi:hypothetical protein